MDSGTPIPLISMHKADPRNYVGDVVVATETDDGLAIKGWFDLDTEFGKSAYRNTKGRRLFRSEHRLRDPQLHQPSSTEYRCNPLINFDIRWISWWMGLTPARHAVAPR